MENLAQRFDLVSVWIENMETFETVLMLFALLGIALDFWRKRSRGYAEVGANIVIGIGNILLSLTAYGLIFIVTLWFAEQVALMKIPMNISTWIVAIIGADFSYYWMHRIEHRVRFFWTMHSVHHSSTEFDLTTGLRLSWFEGLFEWMFFIPLVLLGFDMVQVVVAISLVVTYQTWIHTENIGKLGWLDAVFNTPSTHRVHHGSNAHYIDKNFGGIFMLWDRLFGTYQAEDEDVIYGLTKNIGSSNPLTITFFEWKKLYHDLRKSTTIREQLKYLSNSPGWKPEKKRCYKLR